MIQEKSSCENNYPSFLDSQGEIEETGKGEPHFKVMGHSTWAGYH